MHAQPTALARLRALVLTPAQIYPLMLAQLGALWLIVGTGAAVRLTDSGLGCRPGPVVKRGIHCRRRTRTRSSSSATVSSAASRSRHAARLARRAATCRVAAWVRRLALAVFLGTLAQAPIGLLAIAIDLRWPIVMIHLLLSIALLAGATILVLEVRAEAVGRVEPLVPLELRRLGLAFVGAGFVLIVSGAFATAAGPHSGGGEADKIDRLGRLEPIVYVHAAFVGVFLLTFLFSLGYLAARRDRAPRLFKFGAGVFVLLLAQMGLGEIQWRTHLPWGLVLLHVFLASTVWVGTVALATLFFRPNVDFTDR